MKLIQKMGGIINAETREVVALDVLVARFNASGERIRLLREAIQEHLQDECADELAILYHALAEDDALARGGEK